MCKKIIKRIGYYWNSTQTSIRKRVVYFRIVYLRWEGKENFYSEIAYIKENKRISMFPYAFEGKYNTLSLDKVYVDGKNCYVVLESGKRLFFPGTCKAWVARKSMLLSREQDAASPHLYFTTDFFPEKDEIFIDIGAAEGRECLEVIDNVKETMIFECQKEWMDALERTFEPYEGKVHLYNQEINSDNSLVKYVEALHSNWKEEKYFIKMDIEGAERDVLCSIKDFLQAADVRATIAIYHNIDNEDYMENFFSEMGYDFEYSNGYMMPCEEPFLSKLAAPYFRKGVIRVWKKN